MSKIKLECVKYLLVVKELVTSLLCNLIYYFRIYMINMIIDLEYLHILICSYFSGRETALLVGRSCKKKLVGQQCGMNHNELEM